MYGWQRIERNPTFRGIKRVRELTILVVTGKKALQMFCSLPGIGKTETVLEVFAEYNLEPHYSSPSNPTEFCYDLWLHRDRPYFLDDCDRLARSESCANVGKMVWGPQRLVVVPGSRVIQLNEQRRLDDSDKYNPNIPPPTFRVGPKHGVIWNSNKDFTNPATVAKELVADFAALVSRGLDPYLVPGDPQSVFDYTVYMILEGMLRRHPQADFRNNRGGFKLAHQQAVLDFICTHGRRLKEISPRMAYKLAAALRDDPTWEEAWEDQLEKRTKWNGLILPDDPPRLLSPAMCRAIEPPPAASPDPDPESPPPAASRPVPDLDPEPDPDHTPSIPDPEPTLPSEGIRLPFDAINEVYRLPIETTCRMVADRLRHYPLDQWDRDDFDRLVEGLEGRADWSQCAAIVEPLFALDTTGSHKVFCTESEGVLEYRDGRLEISSWQSIEQRIAPALAEQRRRAAERQREQRGRDILRTRLPKVRKLKAMKALIDEILTCLATISEQGQQVIEHIRAMSRDDPQFADCTTFTQYIQKATEIIDQNPPTGSEPQVHETNVVEFRPSKPR